MIQAERIWINHKSQMKILLVKNCPITSNIKPGPALLQNPSNLLAVDLSIFPSVYASYIHFAPTGYPPSKPNRNIDSHPVGIPHGVKSFDKIPDFG